MTSRAAAPAASANTGIQACSWPHSCPHPDARHVITIICGNSRYHWALHEQQTNQFSPTLFWKTTPVNPDQQFQGSQLVLAQYIPPKAYEMIGGASFEKNRTAKSVIKHLSKHEVSLFHVYVLSTNAEHARAIPKLFASLPCRIQQLHVRDFMGGKKVYPTLGVDRAANLKGAMHIHQQTPMLVIDGGTATTYTASDVDGQFCGGGILPGVGAQMESLCERTGALPKLEYDDVNNRLTASVADRHPPLPTFADNTHDAMMVGVLRGFAMNLAQLVKSWAKKALEERKKDVGAKDKENKEKGESEKDEPKKLFVVVTGGDGPILDKLLRPKFGGCLEDGDSEFALQDSDPVEIVYIKNLCNHAVGQLLAEKMVPEDKLSPQEKLRQSLLGSRIMGKRRGTVYDIQRGVGTSLANDYFHVKYDNGTTDMLSAVELHDRLMDYANKGEETAWDDEAARKRKKEQAKAAALKMEEHSMVPALAAAKGMGQGSVKRPIENPTSATATSAKKQKPSADTQSTASSTSAKKPDAAATPATETTKPQTAVVSTTSNKSKSPKRKKSFPNINKEIILDDPHKWVGHRVAKYFEDILYFGTVKTYDRQEEEAEDDALWHVAYDDGDAEDFGLEDMVKHLKEYELNKTDDIQGNATGDS